MRGSESAFLELVGRRVVFLDGAMGTSIHALDLPLSDYNGLENCCEVLNLTRPDAVEQIHRSFLDVGCDAVETNTFGGMRHVLAEFGLADRCYEINVAAAKIARRACEAFSTLPRPRFVVGSLGPGTKLPTLRQISYDGLLESYGEQARGLIDGGCDAMLIETCQDILHAKAVIWAVLSAFEKTGKRLPLMVQVTMETTGTMLVGTDVAAALVAIEAYPEVDVIGLNCATGPQEMSEHVRYLARNSTRPISVMPNAGLPQLVSGRTHFPLAPAELARWLKEFVDVDGVRIVGGCCGTTPAHLRAVVEAIGFHGNAESNAECRTRNAETGSSSPDASAIGLSGSAEHPPAPATKPEPGSTTEDASAFCILHSALGPSPSRSREAACSSLYQAMPYRQDNSFLIVGERSNTNGSRQFKRLLAEGDIEGLVQVGVEQVKEGAHVLDLCVDYVGRDGVADMTRVADRYAVDVNVPIMLDSTEPEVIEAGLKLIGGKCIVNSVNLEDGEVKMARVARLLRQYGAAVVALTIDEDPIESMAKTAQRKLEIATRIHDLLTRKYGVAEEDIFFDCLTFPITTGNEADRRLALETLDGIEAVMTRFPRCQSILGVSNVSFGLVPAARAVLNSVFLHEARQRGLTAAIVHSSKILPRNQISDERWEAALNLIYDVAQPQPLPGAAVPHSQPGAAVPHEDPLVRFIGLFSDTEQVGTKVKIADLPIEERLKRRIIDGERIGLDADLAVALQTYAPLDIINNLLLDGMKTVGDLFGSGQMQLPFVLKSAETMKAAVALLEPHMDRSADTSRGRIVLATVRGDVHDIGKNLVDIILTNNGYRVFNLGIKQPINNVIAAWREHAADAIGLSGLLVKSTLVMRDDLLVLEEQGIRVPVILGGAALTRGYVENDLRPLYAGSLSYAKDAFEGLRLMGEITATKRRSDEATTGRRDEATERRNDQGEKRQRDEALEEREITQPSAATQPSPDRKGGVSFGRKDRPDLEAASISAAQPPRRLDLDAEQRFGLAAIGETAEDDDAVAEGPLVAASAIDRARAAAPPRRRSEIPIDNAIPAPPFWGARVLEHIPLKAALGYMNEIMLFQVQWGFRKRGRAGDDFRRYIDRDVRPIYRELVARCEREAILRPQAIYGYWPCNSDGDDLIIWDTATKPRSHEATKGEGATKPGSHGGTKGKEGLESMASAPGSTPIALASPGLSSDRAAPSLRGSFGLPSRSPLSPSQRGCEVARFTFPRQQKPPHWCLSDFWRPVESGETDVIALSLVTAGQRVSEVAREWFARNEYQQYLFLHGLGVETAEALAEYVHKQVRMELGIAGDDARERQKLFQQGYQGSRFSFGYPACPNLEDQAKLMQLLEPQRIGVSLSDEYQLDPEQSTSAVIAHHPAARYFSVR
ncbi:MAG: Glutamate mutase sigma subunit [Phycisphaerae bacterium]|nr:Glutamate mutase sigma subunit [Phycisphaerae bacterium]